MRAALRALLKWYPEADEHLKDTEHRVKDVNEEAERERDASAQKRP